MTDGKCYLMLSVGAGTALAVSLTVHSDGNVVDDRAGSEVAVLAFSFCVAVGVSHGLQILGEAACSPHRLQSTISDRFVPLRPNSSQ